MNTIKSAPPVKSPRFHLLALFVSAVVIGGLLAAAPLMSEPKTLLNFRLSVYVTSALFFAAVSGMVLSSQVVSRLRRRSLVLLLVVLLTVVMGLNYGEIIVVSDVAKMLFAAAAGWLLLRFIERPWWLLPVAFCVPLADAWSVYSQRGVTHAIINKAAEEPRWINWPTIATPIAGFSYEQFGRLGIVDVFFMTIFLGAAVIWLLPRWPLLVALPLSFVLTNVLVYEVSSLRAVPALPILCLAFLAVTLVPLIKDLRADLKRLPPKTRAEN